jgi:YD repeat-containing protein
MAFGQWELMRATFTWDHRNRLTKVQFYATPSSTTVLKQIDYRYDVLDRRIGKTVIDGTPVETRFVYVG